MIQQILAILLMSWLSGGIFGQPTTSTTSSIPPKISVVNIVSPPGAEPAPIVPAPKTSTAPVSEGTVPSPEDGTIVPQTVQTAAVPTQERGSTSTQQNPTTSADVQPKVSSDGPLPEAVSNGGGFGDTSQALLQLPGGPISTSPPQSPPHQEETELELQQLQGLMEPNSEQGVDGVVGGFEFAPPPPFQAEYIYEYGSGVGELVVVTQVYNGLEEEIDIEEIPIYSNGQPYSQTDNSEQNEGEDDGNVGNKIYSNPTSIMFVIIIFSISMFLLQC